MSRDEVDGVQLWWKGQGSLAETVSQTPVFALAVP